MPLYQQLADRLQELIGNRVYPAGTRLPGVRGLARQHQVSVSTAVSACRELEQRGLVEARSRSGYFVRPLPVPRETPRVPGIARRPKAVTGQERVLRMVQAVHDPEVVNLGAAVADPDFMPAA
ncbi:GntR family transcriptional regulator, partial [Vibrio agarivorans]